jgi:hypothetical protein
MTPMIARSLDIRFNQLLSKGNLNLKLKFETPANAEKPMKID